MVALIGISVLGGAIAWDQIKTIRRELAAAKEQLKASEEEARELKTKLRKTEASRTGLIDQASRLADASLTSTAANEAYVNALKKKIELLEAQLGSRDASASVRSVSAVSTGSSIPVPPKVNIPRWLPEPQAIIDRKIKERAAKQHGTDYAAAKYEIEWQTEAYEKLVRYHRMNNVTVNDVLSKAVFEKGDDYRSVVWEVERQLEAAKVIQGR